MDETYPQMLQFAGKTILVTATAAFEVIAAPEVLVAVGTGEAGYAALEALRSIKAVSREEATMLGAEERTRFGGSVAAAAEWSGAGAAADSRSRAGDGMTMDYASLDDDQLFEQFRIAAINNEPRQRQKEACQGAERFVEDDPFITNASLCRSGGGTPTTDENNVHSCSYAYPYAPAVDFQPSTVTSESVVACDRTFSTPQLDSKGAVAVTVTNAAQTVGPLSAASACTIQVLLP